MMGLTVERQANCAIELASTIIETLKNCRLTVETVTKTSQFCEFYAYYSHYVPFLGITIFIDCDCTKPHTYRISISERPFVKFPQLDVKTFNHSEIPKPVDSEEIFPLDLTFRTLRKFALHNPHLDKDLVKKVGDKEERTPIFFTSKDLLAFSSAITQAFSSVAHVN